MEPKRYEKELVPKKTRLLLYIKDKDLFDIFNDQKLTVTYLQKELGYKSPSHVYQHLLELEQEGYIEYNRTNDSIRITEKGKQLTRPYDRFKILAIVLTVFGIGFFPIFFYLNEWVLMYSILLSIISVCCGIFLYRNLWQLIKEKAVF